MHIALRIRPALVIAAAAILFPGGNRCCAALSLTRGNGQSLARWGRREIRFVERPDAERLAEENARAHDAIVIMGARDESLSKLAERLAACKITHAP